MSSGAITKTALVMPFPMRQNFNAQIIIPKDMTHEEAIRLCAFVMSLASEQK